MAKKRAKKTTKPRSVRTLKPGERVRLRSGEVLETIRPVTYGFPQRSAFWRAVTAPPHTGWIIAGWVIVAFGFYLILMR